MKQSAFTLLEVILVLILASVMAAVAGRAVVTMDDARSYQKTLRAMEEIRTSLIGNPQYLRNGQRADFGYFGFFGAFPASLSDLQTSTSLIISPNPNYSSSDFWANAYQYDGAAGTGSVIHVESYGADGANGGSGFNTDLEMQIPMDDFTNNTVIVYCADKKGTLLSNGASGRTVPHITLVEIISLGAPVALTASSNGSWSISNIKAGQAYLRVTPNSGPPTYNVQLMGASPPAFMLMPIIVYPKATYTPNEENIYEFRFPGEVTS